MISIIDCPAVPMGNAGRRDPEFDQLAQAVRAIEQSPGKAIRWWPTRKLVNPAASVHRSLQHRGIDTRRISARVDGDTVIVAWRTPGGAA